MSDEPVPVRSYGGPGAWAEAEVDLAVLASAGIVGVVSGDAHLHAPLIGGDQVWLMVAPAEADEAREVLGTTEGSSA